MLAFLIFLATFIFVVARVLLRGKRDTEYVAMAQLPLQEDEDTTVAFPRTTNSPKEPGHEA
ncbi:MAG: hypothetical protein U1F43_35780 [Myxococcota bacterium]